MIDMESKQNQKQRKMISESMDVEWNATIDTGIRETKAICFMGIKVWC